MFEARAVTRSTKTEFSRDLLSQLDGLIEGEPDPIANAANISALLFALMPELNWTGFHFLRVGELVLGPFQGKPACVRIGVGKGVCGAAVSQRKSIVVEDVNAFPGHIACDSAHALRAGRAVVCGRQCVGRARSRQPGCGSLRYR
jgi:L-methionine (R)-S-oxide reductase